MAASPQEPVPLRVQLCQWLWRILIFVWSVLIAGMVVGIIANLSTTPIEPGTSLRAAFAHLFIGYFFLTYPIPIGACGILLVFLTVASWFGSRSPQTASSPASQMSAQDRKHMLQRLRIRYEQSFTQSLQGTVQLELGLTSRPAGISNAVNLALHLPDQPDQPLPPHTSIVDAYEQAKHELLILGAPGAGKSTLLLELARALVAQAERDTTHLLPILIPLSTWAVKRLPLQEWLIAQFALLYNVHPKLSKKWIEAKMILPLLDGLDEVEEAARPACVEAINTYHREHLLPLVVCSRTDEYEQATMKERLALHTAVVIQPLTPAEVNAHLAAQGKSLAALRTTLKKNPVLRQLATTPLMLHILILTYAGTTVRKLPQKKAELEQQIWAAYVERMIARKEQSKHYPLERTVSWLSWLARSMRERNQTIFFLENLQSDVLQKPYIILNQGSVILIIWLSISLFLSLVYWLFYQRGGLPTNLYTFFYILFCCLGGMTIRGRQIKPAERVFFSWKWLIAGASGGLICGLAIGLIFGPVTSLVFVMASGLVLGLISGPFFGLRSTQLAHREMLSPNEGIRRSLIYGLLSMLLFGLLFGLLIGFLSGSYYGSLIGLNDGLIYGLGFGLISGLLFGLAAAIRHYTLRFWLWRAHLFPWKAVSFLEAATTCVLLRRVGGGYSFTHRLLLDYFADLGTSNRYNTLRGASNVTALFARNILEEPMS